MKIKNDIPSKALLARKALLKAKEIIYFTTQLTDAINSGKITPDLFEKKLFVPEPNNGFLIDLDWCQHPQIFKMTADDIQVGASSHTIITANESYANELLVLESSNTDLFSAQMILKLIRNALAHVKAVEGDVAMPFWDIRE